MATAKKIKAKKKRSLKGIPQKCRKCHKSGHNSRRHKNDKKPAKPAAKPKASKK